MVQAMSFMDRFMPGQDPMEPPASPSPFVERDRVVISLPDNAEDLDGQILNGQHGTVVSVQFDSDPDSAFGPWMFKVRIDGDSEDMMFGADELKRETDDPGAVEPVVISIRQPEDDTDEPVPYVPTDSLQPWIQRAKELRHETVFTDTPVYDDVVAEAMSADGLAAEVTAYLMDVAEGRAS